MEIHVNAIIAFPLAIKVSGYVETVPILDANYVSITTIDDFDVAVPLLHEHDED